MPAQRKVAPTYWTTLPQTLARSKRLRVIGRDFGARAPWTFVCLLNLATEQLHATNMRLRADRASGLVAVGWDELAYLAMAEVDDVRQIVDRLATVKPPLIEVRSSDEIGATLVLVEWDRWHMAPKDPDAASRQAKHRANQRAGASESAPKPR